MVHVVTKNIRFLQSLHSPPFRERNWPADGIIASFFGNSSRAALDKVGALPLQRQAYQSMLGQALVIKSQVRQRPFLSTFNI